MITEAFFRMKDMRSLRFSLELLVVLFLRFGFFMVSLGCFESQALVLRWALRSWRTQRHKMSCWRGDLGGVGGNGFSVAFLWVFYGFSMGFLWLFHGFSMVF